MNTQLFYSLNSRMVFPKFLGSLLILISVLYISCNQKSTESSKARPSFKKITGIKYTEVRRSFDQGFSFNDQGFQLEPSWKLRILSDDSVNLYSPDKNRFMNYKIYLDHDSVFNMANAWLRLKKVSKDSILFQVLAVEKKAISRKRSNVYMTFYADQYIKNVLHAVPEKLKQPDRRDTLFIKYKVTHANNNPDSAFAARIPVILKSKSKMIQAEKVMASIDALNNIHATDEYLYPKYRITINKAYKDFYYSFSVYVDHKGQMHFRRSEVYLSPEFEESIILIMKGIMTGYLQYFLEITPGKTLNIPHTSLIILNVIGKKGV